MSRLDLSAVCLFVLLNFLGAAIPLFGSEFVPLGPATGPPADWITENREGILIGANGRIYGSDFADRLTLRERFSIDDVTAAVAVGRRLLLVQGGEHLSILEPEGGDPIELALDSPVRGRLTPAVLGDLLMLAEDGVGLRFMRIAFAHHDAPFELTPVHRLPLVESFTAVTTSTRTAYALTASGRLYEIDGAAPEGPRLVRELSIGDEVHAIAANGDRIFALGEAGLTVYGRVGDHLEALARAPDARGDLLQINGRLIYIAGPDGIRAWRDRTEGSQTHSVTVGNDFFSPVNLAIDVNDGVQWTNASLGGFHNVESCVPATNGCSGQTANETFTSGPVAGPPWTYTYEFIQPGANPYVCISHLPFMSGQVLVGGSGGNRFRVPIDDIGLPMLVRKLSPDGETLEIEWDESSHPEGDFTLLWGYGSGLPALSTDDYFPGGSVCSATAPLIWSNTPDPEVNPSGLIWWMIVPTGLANACP